MDERELSDHDLLIRLDQRMEAVEKLTANHLQHHLTSVKLWIAFGMLLIGQVGMPFVMKWIFG